MLFLPCFKPGSAILGTVTCICVMIVTSLRSSIFYSFGVFVESFVDEFHVPVGEIDLLATTQYGVATMFAPFTMIILQKTGYGKCRILCMLGILTCALSIAITSYLNQVEWMFLTHGIVLGFGAAITYMTGYVVISSHFNKKHRFHVLATSCILCGYPLASLIFNPVNTWLVGQFGWRKTFRIMATVIGVLGGLCSLAYVVEDESEETAAVITREKTQNGTISFLDVVTYPEAMLWLFGTFLVSIGLIMPFVTLPYYLALKNYKAVRASWSMVVLSLSELLAYVICASIGDCFKGRLIYANLFASLCLAILYGLWPLGDVSFAAIMVLSGSIGAFIGINLVYLYPTTGEVVKLPLNTFWSLSSFCQGIGNFIGAIFSGYIYDIRQQYDDVFYTSSGIYGLSVIIFVLIVMLSNGYFRCCVKKDIGN